MRTSSLAALLCLWTTALASAQTIEVLSADSVWMLEDGQRFVRGKRLEVDTRLHADGRGDLLLQCPDQKQRLYSCRAPQCEVKACAIVKDGPVTMRELGWAATAFSALFKREPKPPILAAARAGGNPVDAVLLLDERGLHAGAALARVLEGRYCLRIGALPAGTPGSAATLVLDWDRAVDAAGVVAAPTVTPGLYTLDKGTPEAGGGCRLDADGTTAWVLIPSAKDFAAASAEWTRQGAIVAQLERDGASPSTITTLRHSVLAGLGQTVP